MRLKFFFSRTLEKLGRTCDQIGRTLEPCNSRAVFNESTLRREDCNGSNGGPFRTLNTVGKSQGGTLRGRGGLILQAPHKNVIITLSLPTDRPAIGAWLPHKL